MRSVSQSAAPQRVAGGVGPSGAQHTASYNALRLSSTRLPEEALFVQPVSFGSLGVAIVAGARSVRAVLILDGSELLASEDPSTTLSTSDLSGTISSLCVHSVGGAGASVKCLIAIGTSHGVLRLFVLETSSLHDGPRMSLRSLATFSLAAASSNQISSHDAVVSVAFIRSASQSAFPESIVAASRRCVVAVSLRGVDAVVRGQPDATFASKRAHCSIHNDAAIVRVLPLPGPSESVGGTTARHRTSAASGSALNSVADHCVACVVVLENGAIKYLLRALSIAELPPFAPSLLDAHTSSDQTLLSYHYRLSATCTAMSQLCSASALANHAVVVINDAAFEYDEVDDSLSIVVCGAELSDPALQTNSPVAGVTPTSSQPLATMGSFVRFGPSVSSMFVAPSGSQYSFASASPYASKTSWWGTVRGAIRLSMTDVTIGGGRTEHAPHFTIPALMHDPAYLEAVDNVVISWAATAVARAAPAPLRQSTATPIDRRGFASCTVTSQHLLLLSMGCELHAALNPADSIADGNASPTLTPAQALYSFAATVNACVAVGGGAGAQAQRILVATGSSVHLFVLSSR